MRIIEDYNRYLCTIRELSFDKDAGVSLIEDDEKQYRMFNFDGIKKHFVKNIVERRTFPAMLIGKIKIKDILSNLRIRVRAISNVNIYGIRHMTA